MPTITLETKVRRNNDVFSGIIDGEMVAMNVQNGKYYQLNKTGSRIFSLLEEPRSVKALCRELKSQFKADEDMLQQDVLDFLGEMVGKGLIEAE